MKKKVAAVVAALFIVMAMSPVVFAAEGGLQVDSIFPSDGDTGLQLTNQMARIVFTAPIDENCFENKYFSVKDADGNKEEILVLEQSDDPNRVNIVMKNDLKESMTYTITISGKVADTEGNTLGENKTYTFKTKSQKRESLITTVLMFAMFGAIILFTVRDAKNQQQESQKQGGQKPQKVNPYKEAKKEALKEAERRTGKKIDPSVKNNIKRKAQNKKKK